MQEKVSKLPVKHEGGRLSSMGTWNPFESLHQEIDELFNDVGRGFWRRAMPSRFFKPAPIFEGAVPAVEVVEKAKAYEVSAELPGLTDKDIQVSVSNGTLTITGEKKEEKEEEKKDYYMSERRYGSFSRAFRIPEGADAEKIEAQFKNGVLTITVPKTAQAQSAKNIQIKAA